METRIHLLIQPFRIVEQKSVTEKSVFGNHSSESVAETALQTGLEIIPETGTVNFHDPPRGLLESRAAQRPLPPGRLTLHQRHVSR